MRRTISILALFSVLLTTCEGVPGPPGLNGGLIVADAISVSNVNFTAPYFEIIVDFEPVYSDEVILVYRRWGNNTWRLLPQTIFFDDGNELDYNFDFTQNKLSIFLDSTLDLNTLSAEWTQNQTFRVVIIPAENINGINTPEMTDFDLSNIQQRY